MALELVPLCSATVTLDNIITVSPGLMIGEVAAMNVEGERFRAHLKGKAAADWLKPSTDGTATIDVRATLETDDGAVVYASYSGRLLFDTMTVYATPLFHTGDERYQWLNRIQAVAKGHFAKATTLIYEMYELR